MGDPKSGSKGPKNRVSGTTFVFFGTPDIQTPTKNDDSEKLYKKNGTFSKRYTNPAF
jgi:hypothetical protein